MYYSAYVDGHGLDGAGVCASGVHIVDPEDGEVIPACLFSEIVAMGGSLVYPVRLIEKYVAGEVVEVDVDPDDEPELYERIAKILGVDIYGIVVCRLEYED